jgi:dihydroorotase
MMGAKMIGITRKKAPAKRSAVIAPDGITSTAKGYTLAGTMISSRFFPALLLASVAWAQADYDLLVKGGHVIDGKNRISAVRDVAIKDGKIAAVAANIDASKATKTVDAAGLYVTPGIIDIHVHVYPGLTKNSYASGSLGLQPDGFTLRNGVTSVADAGSAGWRTFEDFKSRIIDTQ